MESIFLQLYSNPNFPIIMYTVIGILVFAFLIVLILYVKDIKKNKKEDTIPDKVEAKEEVVQEVTEHVPTKEEALLEGHTVIYQNFHFDEEEELEETPIRRVSRQEEIKIVPKEIAPAVQVEERKKVIASRPIYNVKSLNQIEQEEYSLHK